MTETRYFLRNDRIRVPLSYGRIGQLNKKLPNPITTGNAPAIPPSTHFHIPGRKSHCRNR
jgi:hypothetical protein